VYSYTAYGLGIRSTLYLPELVPEDIAPEVILRLGEIRQGGLALDTDGTGFWAAADEAVRYLPGIGTFWIRGGREIIVDPAPGVEEQVLRLAILGPAFAVLLHQRGRFVLHASAVASSGSAVVFAGGSGWGKSTLAAALHARGCSMVSDDVTAIVVGGEHPIVLPGFPQFKLWPEAVESLGGLPETLPRLHPSFEKRARHVAHGFNRDHLPLRRIYVLAEGSEPAIEPLQPHEALLELLRHWYGSRFGDRLLQANGAAVTHLHQCAALANCVPIHRLRRPPPIRALFDLAGLVEDDLAHEVHVREFASA
jgi:hypothetical protein